MTPGERSAGLDRQLDESLEEYDASLEGEQQRQAERSKETAEIVGAREDAEREAGGSESGSAASAGSETAGNQGETGGGQGGGEESESGGQPGARSGSGGSGAPGPANLPDGHDDDVVARQLREAAENEEDPELQAKLWEEYRRYKEGGKPPAPAPDSGEAEKKTEAVPEPAADGEPEGGGDAGANDGNDPGGEAGP
jgi:hypothetical protein